MGAGQAALKLGDPQAAVTFFARAEEVAPRDPRIKAGMGSAFVQMEQARSALKFFSDAQRARHSRKPDRRRSRPRLRFARRQPSARSATIVWRSNTRNDPEVERRLALVAGDRGDKTGALAAIDGQSRRQDRAAWRTRAFVLALTGDASGATEAVKAGDAGPGRGDAALPGATSIA